MDIIRRYSAASALKKLVTTSTKIVNISRDMYMDILEIRRPPRHVKITSVRKKNTDFASIWPLSVFIISQG